MDLSTILRFAVKHGISDIHLKVGKSPLFRKNGLLVSQQGAPMVSAEHMKHWYQQVTNPHVQARYEKNREADTAHAVPGIGRFRINCFQQRNNMGMVFRHIPEKVKSISDLKLPTQLEKIAQYPRGLVLVTGATGSGKSTTLAAMLEYINRLKPVHVLTIEDPIEFVFTDQKAVFNQRQVGVDTHSFPAALRSALRQDPDVILIGELRDLETIETAIQAAETGHLVFSTLHTVDAMETISRIIGMFPGDTQTQIRLQLSTILRAVISQRLVRTTDDKRAAACEILVNTDYIRDLMADPTRTHEIVEAMQVGQASYGSQTFDQALLKLIEDKRITLKEALANATNPAAIKMHSEGFT